MSAASSDPIHPAATPHLPSFITALGETDVLMVVTGVILALAVLAIGVIFLRVHALPDQIVHKSHKIQAEIVCVLCLVSLLTHMHIFWIIALLLAVIDLPDFGTPLHRIAGATERIAGRTSGGP